MSSCPFHVLYEEALLLIIYLLFKCYHILKGSSMYRILECILWYIIILLIIIYFLCELSFQWTD